MEIKTSKLKLMHDDRVDRQKQVTHANFNASTAASEELSADVSSLKFG